jgi:uncharacterized RmlC-like cupin family protein
MTDARSVSDLDVPASENAAPNAPTVVTIRPSAETMTRQQLPYFVGIACPTARATGLSMNLVVIPRRGGRAAHPPWLRDGCLSPQRTRRDALRPATATIAAGDFIFIPAHVPHQPVNLSDSEPAHAIVARNDPNEQENVVLYDPDKDESTSSRLMT